MSRLGGGIKLSKQKAVMDEESELQCKNQELKEECQKMESINKRLNEDLTAANDTIEELTNASKHANGTREMRALEEEVKYLERQHKNDSVLIESLEKERSSVYAQIETSEQMNERLQSTIANMREEVVLLQEENAQCKVLVENYERRLDDSSDVYDVLKEKEGNIKRMTSEYTAMKSLLEEDIEAYKSELEASLESIKRKDTEIEILRKESEAMDVELADTNTELNKTLKENATMVEKLKTYEAELIEIATANDSLIQEHHELMGQLKMQPRGEDVKDELTFLVEENKKLVQDGAKLMTANELLKTQNECVEKASSVFERDVKELKKEIQALGERNNTLTKTLEEKQKELLEYDFKCKRLDERCKKNEEKHDLLVDQNDDVSMQRENLGLTLKEKDSYLEDMERQLTETTKHLVELEMQLDSERSHKASLTMEMNRDKDKIDKLVETRNELKEYVLVKENETKQLKLMEKNVMRSNMSLEQDLMARNLEIQRLQQLYEETEAKYQNLHADLQRTKEMLNELEQGKDSVYVDNEILQERIKNLEKEIQKRDNLVMNLKADNQSIEKSKLELQEMKEVLEEEILKVKKEKEEIYEELTKMVNRTVDKQALTETELLLAEQMSVNKEMTKHATITQEELSALETKMYNLSNSLTEEVKSLETTLHKTRRELMSEKEACDRKSKEVFSLREKNSKLLKENEGIHSELDERKMICSNLNEEMQELQVDYKTLNHTFNDLKAEHKNVVGVFEGQKQKCKDQEQQLLEMGRRLNNSVRNEEREKESKNELSKEMRALNERKGALQNKVNEFQQKLMSAETEISKLTVDTHNNVELRNEIESYKNKLLAMTSSYEMVSHRAEQMAVDGAKLEKKIAELESRLKNAVENESRLKSLLQTSEDTCISKEAYNLLKKQLDGKNVELEEALSDVRDAEEEISIFREKQEKRKQTENELRQSLNERNSEVNDLKPRYNNLKTDHELVLRQLKEINQRGEEKDEEIKELGKQLFKKTRTIEGINQEVVELKTSNDQLNEEVHEVKVKMDRLHKQNHELLTEKQDLSEKSLEDNKLISSLKHHLERVERKMYSSDSELEQLRSQLEHEETRTNGYYKKLQESTLRDQSQTDAIDNLTKDIEELNGEIEKLSKALKKSQEQLTVKENEIANALSENATEKRNSNVMSNKLKQTQNEHAKLSHNLDETRAAHNKSIQDFKQAKSDIFNLKNKIATMQEDREADKETIENLSKEVERMQGMETANEVEYAELYNTHQNLKLDFNTQNDELVGAQQKLEQMEKSKTSAFDERKVLKSEVDTVSGKLSALNMALERSRDQRTQLLTELNRSKQKASEIEEAGEESKQAIVKRLIDTENKLAAAEKKAAGNRVEEDRLKKELDMQEKTFKSLQAKLACNEMEILELTERMETVENEKNRMELEVQSLDDEYQTSENERKSLEIEVEEKEKLMQNMQNKISALTKKLEATDENVKEMQKKKKEISNDHSKSILENVKNEKQIAEMKAENEGMLTKLDEKEREINEIGREFDKLEVEKSKLEHENNALRTEQENFEMSLSKMKKQVEQKSVELEGKEHDIKNYQQKLQAIEQKSRISEEKMKEESQLRKDLTDDNQAKGDRLRALNHEFSRQKGEVQCLEAMKRNIEAEKDRALGDYVKCKNSSELLKRERDKLLTENNELKATLAQQRELLREKSKEKRLTEEGISDLKRSLTQHELDFDEILLDNERLKNENSILSGKFDRLQGDTLKEISGKYTESVKLKAELDAVKNELKKRNRYLERQSSSVCSENEFVSLETSYKKEIIALKSQLDKMSHEEANLKSELQLTKNKFDIYLKDRARLEGELKDVTIQLEVERAKHANHEKELKSVQQTQEREKNTFQRKTDGLAREHEHKISYLEQQLQAVRKTHSLEIDSKKVEVESLKRQLQLQTSGESRSYTAYEETSKRLRKNSRDLMQSEMDLKNLKEKYTLKNELYEREIEHINLKYELALAQNGKQHQNKIDEIHNKLKQAERDKEALRKKWNAKFTE